MSSIEVIDKLLANNLAQQQAIKNIIILDLKKHGEKREFCVFCGKDWADSVRGCCGEVRSDVEWFNENWVYSETNDLEEL